MNFYLRMHRKAYDDRCRFCSSGMQFPRTTFPTAAKRRGKKFRPSFGVIKPENGRYSVYRALFA